LRYLNDPATVGDIPKVVDFAREILDMQQRIEDLEYENARLREYERKYIEVIERDAKHASEMCGITLKAILDGVIVAPKLREE
jgi:hypothetical protein